MTENIKCPCCGSEDIWDDIEGYKEWENWKGCSDCCCRWQEDERQPTNAWIACSERLPNKGNPNEYFIVCNVHGNISMDAHLGHNIWDSMMQVTHWQLCPQPPKTESEAAND